MPRPQRSPRPAEGAAAAGTTDAAPSTLGDNLHRIRNRLGLSLGEVSQRSGLAHSSLWKVENHQMSLTYDKLVALTQGLGVDVAELFAAQPARMAPGRRAVSRRGEGPSQGTKHGEYVYPCTELRDRRMTPMLTDLSCDSLEAFGDWSRHAGEEYVYVVKGPVVFASEFYAPLELQTGDSLYYDSGMGHAFLRAGVGEAQILSVVAGPAPDEAAAQASGGGPAIASRGQKGAVRRT